MTSGWQARLHLLDQSRIEVIEAITFEGQPRDTQTFSRPLRFVAADGKSYWIKHHVQYGLVVELIAGRLAAAVGVGPVARILRVSSAALPSPGRVPPGIDLTPYLGYVVGSEDMPETMNARELEPFVGSGTFEPGIIDAASRAAVIVFQSWIGVTDEQALVRLTDGRVLSIDHGGCFGSVDTYQPPSPIVVSIPGVPDDVGREALHIDAVVTRIEAITDDNLFDAIDGVPQDPRWQSDPTRRLAIAEWLAYRRDRLREVMSAWVR